MRWSGCVCGIHLGQEQDTHSVGYEPTAGKKFIVSRDLWTQMVIERSPIITKHAAQLLYYRAAAAWGSGETFEVPDGAGEWVDLTKLFEQYTMLKILKGENDGNSKNGK